MIPTQPLNIMIHMLILFTFLALFFFLNISKVEEHTFKEEITKLVDENLIESVDKSLLKPLVESNRKIFVQLSSLYNHPDESTKERNQGLKITAFFIALIMLCCLISIILTLKYSRFEDYAGRMEIPNPKSNFYDFFNFYLS